ncbi:flagellar biosynthesis protein FlhF [Geotoga petraea]|uniref:Flagellar biosynthesis protein FlhF n=1 Tax=Geotoga petraea TaxID=28234 RepID=A0A1G6K2Q8_9BACT|nr:flagellar biosynthesis protein FlhF [Geotoga petraea]TGG88402.1 flagellar biosynthesis protein FlhF [Geotoga petraea]SDC25178.1 flagellar biosynthesis protein FlhF [Geotoga petraea]
MKVKKYMVKNISEAMDQIRNDFGDDAYILDTKKVKKGGFFGFGGEKYVEVTVLSEKEKNKKDNDNYTSQSNSIYSMNDMVNRNKRLNDRINSNKNGNSDQNTGEKLDIKENEDMQSLLELINSQREVSKSIDEEAKSFYNNQKNNYQSIKYDQEKQKKEITKKSPSGYSNQSLERKKIDEKKDNSNENLDEIKNLINKLNNKINSGNEFVSELKDNLKESGLSKDIVNEIMEEVDSENITENWKSDVTLLNKIKNILMKDIQINKEENLQGKIMLVGPTGIGKTTTLAKIAAIIKRKNKKVAIVTIDTYRIAAADQLKIYADIMGIPAYVCYTPKDLQLTIESLREMDTILIDTAGRSHKNDLQLGELKAFMDTVNPDKKILVCSSNVNTNDLIDIYEKFSISNPNSLIFTKLDETSSFGQIISLSKYTNLPVDYITTGQKVPDDIEKPDYDKLVSEVIKGVVK